MSSAYGSSVISVIPLANLQSCRRSKHELKLPPTSKMLMAEVVTTVQQRTNDDAGVMQAVRKMVGSASCGPFYGYSVIG